MSEERTTEERLARAEALLEERTELLWRTREVLGQIYRDGPERGSAEYVHMSHRLLSVLGMLPRREESSD